MLRLAYDRMQEIAKTAEEDTLDLIKLIVEWRGRNSIVTQADKYYVEEVLSLDVENSKGLLDLYEIIGARARALTS